MKKWAYGFIVFFLSLQSHAGVCRQWGAPVVMGRLDTLYLGEASGMAISSQFPGRTYHINDHGSAPIVYQSSLTGELQDEIKINNLKALDTEELALGSCGTETCLFVGDIGDNDRRRPSVWVSWVKELKHFAGRAALAGYAELVYPDGPHNAEAMVVHPNGDLFIFTKEVTRESGKKKQPGPTRVYHLRELVAGQTMMPRTLEFLGSIDVPALMGDAENKKQVVTGAAISPDQMTLLLLTYAGVLQIPWDFHPPLTSIQLPAITRISFEPLHQQEAIAFLPGANSFVVSTEAGKHDDSSLLRFDCQAAGF